MIFQNVPWYLAIDIGPAWLIVYSLHRKLWRINGRTVTWLFDKSFYNAWWFLEESIVQDDLTNPSCQCFHCNSNDYDLLAWNYYLRVDWNVSLCQISSKEGHLDKIAWLDSESYCVSEFYLNYDSFLYMVKQLLF